MFSTLFGEYLLFFSLDLPFVSASSTRRIEILTRRRFRFDRPNNDVLVELVPNSPVLEREGIYAREAQAVKPEGGPITVESQYLSSMLISHLDLQPFLTPPPYFHLISSSLGQSSTAASVLEGSGRALQEGHRVEWTKRGGNRRARTDGDCGRN